MVANGRAPADLRRRRLPESISRDASSDRAARPAGPPVSRTRGRVGFRRKARRTLLQEVRVSTTTLMRTLRVTMEQWYLLRCPPCLGQRQIATSGQRLAG